MYTKNFTASNSDEHVWGGQMLEEYDEYLRGLWNDDPVVYASEELQQTIKNHHGFSAVPLGPIGDCIVSNQLRDAVPQSFTASYVVNCVQDSRILRELVSTHGDPQPTIIVYPYQQEMYTTVDENITVDTVPIATLRLENPTIANLVIDHFGTTKGM